jgi:TatD DNase family protein
MMIYADSHTHLDHCLDGDQRTMRDAARVVRQAHEAGVGLIIQSGTDVRSSLWALAAAQSFPQVWATVGFHPHDAKEADEEALAAIAALTAHPRVIGVGEVGLDFYWDNSPRDVQREIFLWHVELAYDASLPLIVHSREAEQETLDLLAEHASGLTVIMHCFSMPDRVDELAERGYFMSFAGNVTYKNAGALRQAVERIPSELLLLETDAPYLAPEPGRGRPNAPAQVVETYRFVAGVRGVTPEELGEQVTANLHRAFARLSGQR